MAIETIPEYIEQFDGDVRLRLETVYALVQSAVPAGTTESISWQMPAFMLGKEPLFFVTAAKRHLSFYPTGAAIEQFAAELAGYDTTEHAIRFPHREPLPMDLIQEIVTWRLAQVEAG